MDWSGCELVEEIPGKLSGQWLVRGTRVTADAIIVNYDGGSPLTEIADNYPGVPTGIILGLIAFHHSHHLQTTS